MCILQINKAWINAPVYMQNGTKASRDKQKNTFHILAAEL